MVYLKLPRRAHGISYYMKIDPGIDEGLEIAIEHRQFHIVISKVPGIRSIPHKKKLLRKRAFHLGKIQCMIGEVKVATTIESGLNETLGTGRR